MKKSINQQPGNILTSDGMHSEPDPDNPPVMPDGLPVSMEALKSLSVLYVEDDPYTLKAVNGILNNHVGKLYTANNGQEGLLAFVKYQPDVIITDILMPKMDGLQMCKSIRSIRHDIPLIITTCMDDARFLQQALELGVCSYVTKPIFPKMLFKALTKIADDLQNQRDLVEQKRLNELLLNSLPYPALLLNRDSRQVLSVNKFAAELGTSVGDSLSTPFFQEHFFVLTEALAHGFPQTPELTNRLKEIQALGRTWTVTLDLVTDSTVLFFAVDISERKALEVKLHKLATTDGLTGLYNRRHFLELANCEFSRTRRYNASMSLIMFDVDHFKRINDEYGHDSGDEALIALAQTSRETLRDFDIIGRLGGEEFAVILPECTEETTWIVAERLRAEIEKQVINTPHGDIGMTVSLGLCIHDRSDVQSVNDMLRIADKGLYMAKNNGRNRVEMLPHETGSD